MVKWIFGQVNLWTCRYILWWGSYPDTPSHCLSLGARGKLPPEMYKPYIKLAYLEKVRKTAGKTRCGKLAIMISRPLEPGKSHARAPLFPNFPVGSQEPAIDRLGDCLDLANNLFP